MGESMNYLVRKPDAGKPHVRFDERGVETESTASYSGTSNRKGWSPLRLRLNFTAPLLDSTLPVWLDLGACRVVHAAWDDEGVKTLGTQNTLTKRNLAKVRDRLTPEGKAVNFLLKGPEYNLGDRTLFVDKQGFSRISVRAKWWILFGPA